MDMVWDNVTVILTLGFFFGLAALLRKTLGHLPFFKPGCGAG